MTQTTRAKNKHHALVLLLRTLKNAAHRLAAPTTLGTRDTSKELIWRRERTERHK